MSTCTMQFEYDPERLIEEVKKRPGIWDFEHPDYRAKNVRQQLWDEVVAELLTTETDVKVTKSELRVLEMQLQKKWKSIRDCFQKYNQNPNRTRRPYIYNKQLQFLLKNQATDNVSSSESEDGNKRKRSWKPKRKLELKKGEETSEEDNNVISDNESREYHVEIEPTPAKVGKKSKSTTEEFVFANVEAKNDLDDPDKMFLLSLLPHFKSIPEEMRINVKMDLMQVLKCANFSYRNSAGGKFC